MEKATKKTLAFWLKVLVTWLLCSWRKLPTHTDERNENMSLLLFLTITDVWHFLVFGEPSCEYDICT